MIKHDDPQADLRARLRERLGRGLGQKSAKGLAAALGLSKSQVSRMVNGGRLVKAHELAIIEQYLDNAEPKGHTRLRLRALMEARGWTFQELSSRTGISISMLSRAARDERWLSRQNLEILARVFDVQATELFEGASASASPNLEMESELATLEGLVSTLKIVRSSEGATSHPPDPNVVRAMLALIDAVAEQVAKLRKM
jgi:transcriptional regulator with XRE-family HTH domain